MYKKPRRCDNYAHMDKHLVGRRNRADRQHSTSVPPPGSYGSITDPHKSATYTESAPAIFSSAAWYAGGDAQQMNVPGKPAACMTSAHQGRLCENYHYHHICRSHIVVLVIVVVVVVVTEAPVFIVVIIIRHRYHNCRCCRSLPHPHHHHIRPHHHIRHNRPNHHRYHHYHHYHKNNH